VKITITMELDAEHDDPEHAMGITVKGYDLISEALEPLGTDITVERA